MLVDLVIGLELGIPWLMLSKYADVTSWNNDFIIEDVFVKNIFRQISISNMSC